MVPATPFATPPMVMPESSSYNGNIVELPVALAASVTYHCVAFVSRLSMVDATVEFVSSTVDHGAVLPADVAAGVMADVENDT